MLAALARSASCLAVAWRTPRNALALLPSNQHDSEASFVSHHASVSFHSICQRNGFDHRTDLLQGAKGNRVRSREPPRFEQEETEGTEIGTKISSLFSLFAPVQSARATTIGREEQVLRAAETWNCCLRLSRGSVGHRPGLEAR